MNKKLLLPLILAVVSFIIIIMLSLNSSTKKSYISVGGKQVFVEYARTPSQHAKGLMHRESLDENSGMLFVFSQETFYPFWMKNTLIPLDIIWINSNMKIVDIKTAQPCTTPQCPTYVPNDIAKYVLEVNGDWAQKNNIKIGDTVDLIQ